MFILRFFEITNLLSTSCGFDSRWGVKVAKDEEDEIILQYTYTYDAAGNIASIIGKETTDTKEGLAIHSAGVMTYDEGNKTLTRFLYNGRFGISTDDNGLE